MAETIIRNRAVVTDDWLSLDDESPAPASGRVVVSRQRFERDAEALLGSVLDVGVRIDGEDDARELAPFVDRLAAVFVEFPTYADGRGYSHARILRDQLGFTGELRAVGEVLRDQMFYLERVGFDAFETAPGQSIEGALEGLNDFSVTYQAAADDERPIYRRGITRPSGGDAPSAAVEATPSSDRTHAVGY